MLPPWYGEWSEREKPLAKCPEAGCRRMRACRRAGAASPCLRTHEHLDEVRDRISAVLRQAMIDAGKDPDIHVTPEEENSYEFQLKLKAMKESLERRERELADEEERNARARTEKGRGRHHR